MSPDTTDFTPIFNQLEAKKPDVIITGISHIGVQPTVQWASQQVPDPDVRHFVAGDLRHVLEGHQWRCGGGGRPGDRHGYVSRPRQRPIPFAQAYTKKYGLPPAYSGYGAYDEVYYIADAVPAALARWTPTSCRRR